MTATIVRPPAHRPAPPLDVSGPPLASQRPGPARRAGSNNGVVRGVLTAARPHQWVKNVAVLFVPGLVLFSLGVTGIALALLATVAFCLVSSSVYLLNDVIDRDHDRYHPTKRNRPISSGLVSPRLALAASAVFAGAGLALGATASPALAAILALYLLSTGAYSNGLKRIAYLDVSVLAAGFVLRVLAGAVAVGAAAPPLLLVAVFAGAAFIALGKRRTELLLLGEDAVAHRSALRCYRLPQLDVLLRDTEGATVLAFGLWLLAAIGGLLGAVTGIIGAVSLLSALDTYRLSLQRGKGANPTIDIVSNYAVMSGLALAAMTALSTGLLR